MRSQPTEYFQKGSNKSIVLVAKHEAVVAKHEAVVWYCKKHSFSIQTKRPNHAENYVPCGCVYYLNWIFLGNTKNTALFKWYHSIIQSENILNM